MPMFARGGRHAGEHVIAAVRTLYNRAIADGLIELGASPAHKGRQTATSAQHPPRPHV
ncbi:hypothetical protein [Asanoa ishikariensis]|nr:hypothetical protein [Asanoa ishikariensis]